VSPDATRKHHPLSRLAADARYAAGHRSEPQTAADTRDGYQHQPGHRRRTPAIRGVVVREAANGQSADRSDSLQLPLLSQGRPCGRPCGGRPRAGSDTMVTGEPASPSHTLVPVASMGARRSRRASTGWSGRILDQVDQIFRG
jgi:hypothetical protein